MRFMCLVVQIGMVMMVRRDHNYLQFLKSQLIYLPQHLHVIAVTNIDYLDRVLILTPQKTQKP